MNGINKVYFYRNYYEAIRFLKPKERMELYDAIFEYIFEDKEPSLKGITSGIWSNISIPLKKSKEGVLNGKKGGAPVGNENAKKVELKNNQKTTPNITQKQPSPHREKQPNNISIFLFLISNFYFNNISNDNELIEIIKEWLKYKEEKKDKYTEIGLKNLLKQIDSNCSIYGTGNVIDVIKDSMANNYKGIVFGKLEKKENQTTKSNNPFLDYLKENENIWQKQKQQKY